VIREPTLGINMRPIGATKQEAEESPKGHFILIEYNKNKPKKNYKYNLD